VHDVPIAPLTLLVGENSTGKSTFLALARLAWDLAAGNSNLDFNEHPFGMGTFDDMAFFHGGDWKRAEDFEIGGTLELSDDLIQSISIKHKSIRTIHFFARFVRYAGRPSLSGFFTHSDDNNIIIRILVDSTINGSKRLFRIEATVDQKTESFPLEIDDSHKFGISEVPNMMMTHNLTHYHSDIKNIMTAVAFLQASKQMLGSSSRPFAMAPNRSDPARTYDVIQINRRPDGSHIPQVLSRLAIEGGETWKRVRERLEKFGKDSGLFSKLIVRHLGDRRTRDSDPFQIQIGFQSFKGKPNLVDVGYGISQVLPVILDSIEFDSQKRDFLLIQQPEVHLHPRAQAELGTFYFNEIKPNKRILIETHSDHLIDRVRMEARDAEGDRRENHKHVLILYFERKLGATKIHPIRISETGDLIEVPDGYRNFFMQEERRFLGF
jgi:hypothetical protein